MTTRRYIFKKWDKTKDTTKCDSCQNQTLFFITDRKTGEEFWCCVDCAYKKYKIKRLKSLLNKYPIHNKKTILAQNSLIKNSTNTPQNHTSEGLDNYSEEGENSLVRPNKIKNVKERPKEEEESGESKFDGED